MPERNSALYRGLDRVCHILTGLSMLMLALMSILVLSQVILRNFFDMGLPWADELSRIANIALVFFVIPPLLLRNRHIAIDLFYTLLPRRGQAFVRRLDYLLIAGFAAIFCYGLYIFLIRAGKFSTPAMGLSNLVVYAPVVVGGVLLCVMAVYRLIVGHEPEPDYAEHHDEFGGSAIEASHQSETKGDRQP